MAQKQFSNGAQSVCSSAITSTQGSIVLASTATFSPSGDFYIRIDDTGLPGSTKNEYCLCTTNTLSTNTLTGLTRGSDSSSPQSFAPGATVSQVINKQTITDAFARLDVSANQTLSGGLTVAGHLIDTGGTAPTFGALATGISSQTLTRGNDTTGIITLISTGSAPTAGNQLCQVVFASAYSNTPAVFAVLNNGNGGAINICNPFFVTTTGFYLYATINLANSTTYNIGYMVMGT